MRAEAAALTATHAWYPKPRHWHLTIVELIDMALAMVDARILAAVAKFAEVAEVNRGCIHAFNILNVPTGKGAHVSMLFGYSGSHPPNETWS